MKLLKPILDNPKTSFAGLGAILAALLAAFRLITTEQAAAITSAAAGLGLIFSSDAKPQ